MELAIKSSFGRTLLQFAAVVLLSVFSFGAYAQDATPPSQSAAKRVTLTECEGVNNCATWTFLSEKGYGKWRSGEEAVLEVKSVKDNQVVIVRTDVTGSKAGLTATYKGTLSDDRIGGEFVSLYNGHKDSGNWYAMLGAIATNTPSVMHFCAANCVTLVWDKDHFTAEGAPGNSVWTVESFTRDSLIMHRTDYRPYSGTAVVKGQISSDGNSIVNGTITWTSHPGLPGVGVAVPFRAAWGAALDTVPGSDVASVAQEPLRASSAPITAHDVISGFVEFTDFVKAGKWWYDLLLGRQ
jgi:hypothetical protein